MRPTVGLLFATAIALAAIVVRSSYAPAWTWLAFNLALAWIPLLLGRLAARRPAWLLALRSSDNDPSLADDAMDPSRSDREAPAGARPRQRLQHLLAVRGNACESDPCFSSSSLPSAPMRLATRPSRSGTTAVRNPVLNQCECNLDKVVIPRVVVPPGGTVTMEVRISVLDSAANFPCTYEIQSLVPPGESDPNYPAAYLVREASPPGAATTTNDLIVGTPTVNPVAVLGLGGTSSAYVEVTIPVNVDASQSATWDHIYEMSATIVPVQPTDPDFDTCVIDYREGVTKSEFGTNLSDVSLRPLNGDICVVPNGALPNGGEVAIGHGFVGDPSGGEWPVPAYHGRFGGHFLDENGGLTVADFKNRVIREHIDGDTPHTDTCYDQALAKGYDPDAYNCPDLTTREIDEGEWAVGASTCAAAPIGQWGVCCHAESMDSIGQVRRCVDNYLNWWDTPTVPAAITGCEVAALQTMEIGCRIPWDWYYAYVPLPWSLGQTLIWDGADRHATAWRSAQSVNLTRAWQDYPAVCTP